MNKKVVIIVGIGVALLCCIAGVVLLLVTGGGTLIRQSFKQPEKINITVDVPLRVTKDETVIIEIRIENSATEAQLLHSVDIDNSYLEGIVIQKAEPAFYEDYPLQIFNMHTHTFEQDIPAGETLVVRFTGIAIKTGDFSGSIDVCINTGGLCKSFTTRTVVEE